MTAEKMTQAVLNTVLPDDAEETGESHPWAVFSAALADSGIDTTPEHLAGVPYLVLFSPRLSTLIERQNVAPAIYTEVIQPSD
jgi:hypothetical protein